MTPIALIFPGQGAQKVGMGLEFFQNSPQAKAIFDQADQICANHLTQVMFEGPQETLTSTAYCQPAILTMSIAALKAFQAHPKFKSYDIKFTAGLSLGEYSALVASGMMDFGDALRLVQKRAGFMEEATKEAQGAMAAVIGFDAAKLVEICKQTGAEVANFNSNEQIVITGHKAKVDAAMEAIKAAGPAAGGASGPKVIPLTVSGAFHSSLMASAASKFSTSLKDIRIRPSAIQTLSNVTAQPHNLISQTNNVIPAKVLTPPMAVAGIHDQIQANLAKQITHSVQWVKCVEYMAAQGITNFIEIGPGRVLKGLMRRINPALSVSNIEKPQDLEALI